MNMMASATDEIKTAGSITSGWDIQQPDIDAMEGGNGRSRSDLEKRQELALEVEALCRKNGWSKKEASNRIGMPEGSFNQWHSGKYASRYDKMNEKVMAFLETVHDMQALGAIIPQSPYYMTTSASKKITDLMMIAQSMSTVVVGACSAGIGKTITAEKYVDGHSNVWLATMTPYGRTPHAALQAVADAVGISDSGMGVRLQKAIGEKVKRKHAPTLLIIDESQDLLDDAVNQIRHFSDRYKCGVAFLGNNEVYGRFKSNWSDKERYAQLRSRIFKRISINMPETSDLVKFIGAHGIKDPAQVKFLTGVGKKPGAFRTLDMTIRLAKMTAMGLGREPDLSDLKKAWHNRDVEA